MSRLLETMKNDLRHVKIEESDDFDDAYVIYDASDDYPFATVYHADAGYSVFEVINDHFRGVAIDDEKIVATKLTVNQAVNAIKQMHRVQYGWENYKVAPEVFEGVINRWNGGSIDVHR